MGEYPETDWRTFRELREVALDRYCRNVLKDVQQLASESALTSHERFLRLCEVVRDRNRTLAHAFDDVRRSRMIQQLSAIQALGLLTPDEMGRFSHGVRETLERAVHIE